MSTCLFLPLSCVRLINKNQAVAWRS
uniref:Uncharacterized protein n=1 Tax=Arundo donax TaxID=35708 RepID=A0A0A9A4Z5_ARUDO